MPWKTEERQQLRQIAFQLPHHRTIERLSAAAKGTKRGCGLAAAVGAMNRLRVHLDRVVSRRPTFSRIFGILCTQQR